MHRVENPDTGFSSRFKNLRHMRNTLVALGDALYAIPYFAALGNEVVIGIDYDKSGDLFLIGELWHLFLRSVSALPQGMALDAFCEHGRLLLIVGY
jgi:hypothetical protein